MSWLDTVSVPAAPSVELTSERRAPKVSVNTVARTPMPAALIEVQGQKVSNVCIGYLNGVGGTRADLNLNASRECVGCRQTRWTQRWTSEQGFEQ